jgi:hypothetical protein
VRLNKQTSKKECNKTGRSVISGHFHLLNSSSPCAYGKKKAVKVAYHGIKIMISTDLLFSLTCGNSFLFCSPNPHGTRSYQTHQTKKGGYSPNPPPDAAKILTRPPISPRFGWVSLHGLHGNPGRENREEDEARRSVVVCLARGKN